VGLGNRNEGPWGGSVQSQQKEVEVRETQVFRKRSYWDHSEGSSGETTAALSRRGREEGPREQKKNHFRANECHDGRCHSLNERRGGKYTRKVGSKPSARKNVLGSEKRGEGHKKMKKVLSSPWHQTQGGGVRGKKGRRGGGDLQKTRFGGSRTGILIGKQKKTTTRKGL